MANAAEEQVALIARQNRLTQWEIGALVITVAFTAWAAIAASKAAGAAGKTVDVIVDTERANVWVMNVALPMLDSQNANPIKLSFTIAMTNAGATMGFVEAISTGIAVGPLPAVRPSHQLQETRIPVPTGGQVTANSSVDIPINAPIRCGIKDGKLAMHVYGTVKFSDFRDGLHTVGYAYLLAFNGQEGSVACHPVGGRAYWTYEKHKDEKGK